MTTSDDDLKTTTLNQVKRLGNEMTNEMASQMWYPLAKCCDSVTYWNVSDPDWVDGQVANLSESDDSGWNPTSYGNVARIAMTWPCETRGIKCSEKLRDLIFS